MNTEHTVLNRQSLYKATGILAIVQSILMATCFVLLAKFFGYPDIIREAPGVIFSKLNEGSRVIPLLYYGLAFSSLLLIFVSVLLKKVFENETNSIWVELGHISGVLAGLLFLTGFMRYVILFPWMADLYVTGNSDPKNIELMFLAFNKYVGFSVTEHIGFILLSGMIIFFAITFVKTKLIHSWIGWLGLIIGIGLLYGNTEILDFPHAFFFNRLATKLAGIWMLMIGISLLVKRTPGKTVVAS